ncbi:MAG: radical SAM protein [Desulfuromonadaceae bacterium]|nr:radical SAM protein [Desulfuromonadaceae bacterium]
MTFYTVVATLDGEIFEHPEYRMAGMSGTAVCIPGDAEMIPLPEGSRLFTMPGVFPVGINMRSGAKETIRRLPRSMGGEEVQAVCAFISPAYMRTYLPAVEYPAKRQTLPLWAYTALAWCAEDECFYVPALKVDRSTQWQAEYFDDRKVVPGVDELLGRYPDNRLLVQLSRCALDYHCFAAKNLFLKRWEAPLPTSPTCNSNCLGCLSYQAAENECCPSSQERIDFVPSVEELVQVAVPHLQHAENAIVSFGQGCEGDPIMQADVISAAIKAMRRETRRGTINFNSNASLPHKVKELAAAGLDSIRISLNSVREPTYNAYYRPNAYRFADVLESVRCAKEHGLFVMFNYLVFPGITDQREELEALIEVIDECGVDMLQLRNLAIDPCLYLHAMPPARDCMGMAQMFTEIKERIPRIQYGYFNRTKNNFYPAGFERDWPLSNN